MIPITSPRWTSNETSRSAQNSLSSFRLSCRERQILSDNRAISSLIDVAPIAPIWYRLQMFVTWMIGGIRVKWAGLSTGSIVGTLSNGIDERLLNFAKQKNAAGEEDNRYGYGDGDIQRLHCSSAEKNQAE